MPGHIGAVRAVTNTPDGRVIATAGDDRAIRIWDGREAFVLDLSGAPRKEKPVTMPMATDCTISRYPMTAQRS